MRILLVAHSYPPDPIVGAFRAAKLAKAFCDAGHEVIVVTSRLPGESSRVRVAQPGLTVRSVRALPHPRHLYVKLKGQFVSSRREQVFAGQDLVGEPGARQEPLPTSWKRWLISVLQVPDESQGFAAPALLASLQEVRRGVDLVYTTAPPFSDHLVGLILKCLLGIRWVIEFRDPWVDNPERPASLTSGPAGAANRWLERQCLRHADDVVAVAESTRDLLARKVGSARQDRVHLALNGIDRIEAPATARPRPGPFRVVHTGSFNEGRNPHGFLRALANLKSRLHLTAGDVRVEFIGIRTEFRRDSLNALLREMEIEELVELTEWMPQDECRDRIRDAHLLLLLFQQQEHQIANKLYDYLGARRPILAVVRPDGEVARMLGRIGGHYVTTDTSAAAVEQALERALRERRELQWSPDTERLLEEWSTANQMRRLIHSIGAAPRAANSVEPEGLGSTAPVGNNVSTS